MTWRLAYSLEKLRHQIDTEWPNRSKLSDGTIGDEVHQQVPSDHNPNSVGVVCAFDITHDPGVLDAHALADRLIRNRHPNLKYIISNRRIADVSTGWEWVPYDGSNPHDKHIHVSVGVGPDGESQPGTYDDTTNWAIGPEEQPMPDESDIINFLIRENGDPNYKPSQDEINSNRSVSFKDWAYRLSTPNDGDAVNYLRADTGDPNYNPSPSEKYDAVQRSHKGWAYKFSGRVDGQFTPYKGNQLFVKE